MTRILITGAEGQLGRDLDLACQRAGDEVVALGRSDLDISDPDSVIAATRAAAPDVVVNCAAWTAVDACESDPERAQLVNGDSVGYLASAAEEVGAHLVQISTDYVFDGAKQEPYVETDTPHPLSAYGRSKLEGERQAGDTSTIVRTSWVCGRYGNNMVVTVLGLLAKVPRLRFVDDQFGNPTFTVDLATSVRTLAVERSAGIYHVTNSTPDGAGISWYRFVSDIVALAGADPAIVEPIRTDQLDPPRPAPRPVNGVLASTKLDPLPDYHRSLADLVSVLDH